MMIIKVEKVTGKDLQPGDLFSTVNEEWWGSVNDRDMDPAPVGEKVYIRTNAPCPEDQKDDALVRLTIHHEVQCPSCEGQPEVDGETCTGCGGTGTLAKEDFDATGH